jgi:hypothetical protein
MNEEELKRLIGKYYNGESTEEEESALRDFFNKGNVPAGYEAEKEIFGYYDDTAEIPEPSHDFEAQIMAAIDASAKKRSMRRILLPLLSAAAGLLILGGSYFFFINKASTRDTFSDPAIAYAETVKILHHVSTQLNQGAKALEPIGKLEMVRRQSIQKINNTTKIAEKSLRELNLLKNTDRKQ